MPKMMVAINKFEEHQAIPTPMRPIDCINKYASNIDMDDNEKLIKIIAFLFFSILFAVK